MFAGLAVSEQLIRELQLLRHESEQKFHHWLNRPGRNCMNCKQEIPIGKPVLKSPDLMRRKNCWWAGM